MPIVVLLLGLALIGVVTWLLITYVPMPPQIKTLIVIVAVILCLLVVFNALGFTTLGPNVPRLR